MKLGLPLSALSLEILSPTDSCTRASLKWITRSIFPEENGNASSVSREGIRASAQKSLFASLPVNLENKGTGGHGYKYKQLSGKENKSILLTIYISAQEKKRFQDKL